MRKQQGFTLIELVIVIVILGILGALIVPRFGALSTEARAATVEAMGGSSRGAAVIVHSLWEAQAHPATVTVEGQTITLTNGWPAATAAGITAALQDITGFTPNYATADTAIFVRDGATTPATCRVTYKMAAADAAPTFTVATGGC